MTQYKWNRSKGALVRNTIAAALCLAAGTSFAIDTTWQNAGTSNWFTGSNWSPGTPNPSFEYAYINQGKATITTPGATALFVRLATTQGTNGTLEISGAGTANFQGIFIGDFAVDGGLGTINILNGGKLTTYGASIGASLVSTGVVLVDGAGSEFNINQNLNVGYEGSGTITVANGASLNVGGGSGEVLLSSARISKGILNIGTGGAAGTINASKIQFGPLQYIESGWFGDAQLNFNHNESNYVFNPVLAGYLKVQQVGTGTTVLNTDGGFVGQINSTNGKLIITANYTRVPTEIPVSTEPDPPPVTIPPEYINVNANGGIMELRDGGSIEAHEVVVGGVANTTGTLTLDGAGTHLNVEVEKRTVEGTETFSYSGSAIVGTVGTGILNIGNGAKLSINELNEDTMVLTQGAGTLQLASGLNATGILNIGDGAILNLAKIQGGPGSYLVTDKWNGNAQVNFVNAGSYTFDRELTGQLKLQQKGAGTTTLTKNSGFSGEINVENGTLVVNSTITKVAPAIPRDPNDPSKELDGLTKYDVSLNVNVGQNGTLTGSGSIDADHTTVAGTLAPGNGLGLIDIKGDLTLTNTAEIVMELAGFVRGVLHDGLNGEGILTLDGELVLVLTSGFLPELGDTFTLFEGFDSIVGEFDKITFLGYEGLYGGSLNGSVLTITVPPISVPEPQTYALIALALGMIAFVQFRRRTKAKQSV